MARRPGGPTIEVRRYTLADGSVSESFSVRYLDAKRRRRRKTFRTRPEAEAARARLADVLSEQTAGQPRRTGTSAGLSSAAPVRLVLARGAPVAGSSWRAARAAALSTATSAPGARALATTSDAGSRLAAGLTLDEFWPLWIGDARTRLQPRTYLAHERVYRSKLGPKFGAVSMRLIRPRAVSQWKTEMAQAGVGPDAIRKAIGLLQAIFAVAIEWGEADSNPARAIRKPRTGRRRAVAPIAPDGIERLRRAIADGDLMPGLSPTLVSVLAYAGLRPGEALGLQLRHLRERTILIDQAVSDGALKVQKTGRVYRTVDKLGPLAEDLAAWIELRAITDPEARLFPRTDGGWWRKDDWDNWRNRHFTPAAAAAGLGRPRPYDLRHSFVSLLIREQRTSIVELADQLGHSPTMTLNTYGHVFAEHRREEPIDVADWIHRARSQAGLLR